MATEPTDYDQSETYKEILSQGDVWQSVLQELKQSASVERILRNINQKTSRLFVGCGTSFYLAEAAATSWTLLTGEPARAVPGSEILLYPSLTSSESADLSAIVISRSGRTSEAVRAAHVLRKEMQIPTIGITCAEKSELEAECDSTLVLKPADEKSMVMTRSFTSMLISLQWTAAQRAGNASSAIHWKRWPYNLPSRSVPSRTTWKPLSIGILLKTTFFLARVPFTALRAKPPSKSWRCPAPIVSLFTPSNSVTARKQS